jgi:hypothetical protein
MFFTVRDTDNAVVDITGYTFRMTVDPSPSPANADNNLFTVDGVVVDGPNGRVSLQPSTLNTNQTPRTYFYDIQMTTTTPSVRTIFAGKFEIRQDITKT